MTRPVIFASLPRTSPRARIDSSVSSVFLRAQLFLRPGKRRKVKRDNWKCTTPFSLQATLCVHTITICRRCEAACATSGLVLPKATQLSVTTLEDGSFGQLLDDPNPNYWIVWPVKSNCLDFIRVEGECLKKAQSLGKLGVKGCEIEIFFKLAWILHS